MGCVSPFARQYKVFAFGQNHQAYTSNARWNDTTLQYGIYSRTTPTNTNGTTYVAYLFAHDEQDFGEDSDETIMRCGSYTGNSGSQTIDVGFEAQWVLIKNTTSGSTDWFVVDMMRGLFDNGAFDSALLRANANDAEQTSGAGGARITARTNGFGFLTESNLSCNRSGETYIYVAIRRPHKPASEFAARDLFTPSLGINMQAGGDRSFATPYPVDLAFQKRFAHNEDWRVVDRIRAGYRTGHYLETNTADNEAAETYLDQFDHSDGIYSTGARDFTDRIAYLFRRAPGFCDVVGYRGYFQANCQPL